MSPSPFVPAFFAFLFSSLFSFANTALEGDWERLDGGAHLRLMLGSTRLQSRARLLFRKQPARIFQMEADLLTCSSHIIAETGA
jgi:hypothetical protein